MSEQRLQLSAVEINGSYCLVVFVCVCENSESVVNVVCLWVQESLEMTGQTSSGRTLSHVLLLHPKSPK